jgi:hypothetical protein
MRIQEIYNQYCKKQISGDAFLRQVRLDPLLKEFVSPVNSLNDVILILKQKCCISEQVTNEDMVLQEKDVASYEDEKGEAMPQSPEFGEELEEDYQDDEFYEELDEKFGNPDIRKILADNDDLGFDLPGAAMNAILTHKDWAERWEIEDPVDIDKVRAWRDEVIRKAKAKKGSINEAKKPKKGELTIDQVNPYEFRKGWKYEYEKSPALQKDQNIEKAKEIALRNVSKNPIYYTELFSKKPGDTKGKKAPKKDENIPAAKNIKNSIELKDKVGQMKNVNKGKDKSNVTSSNKERANGKPKGVKVMKLKEQIRKELRQILSESGKLKEEILSFDEIKKTADKILNQVDGDKNKAIEKCKYALDIIKHDPGGQDRSRSKELFTKVQAYLSGHKDLSVKPEKDAFSTNESAKLDEGWKSWVTGGLLTLSTIGGIGKLYQIDKSNKEAIKKAKEIFAEPLNKMSAEELTDLEDKVEEKLGGSIKTWSSSAIKDPDDSNLIKGFVKKDIENAVTKRPELFGIDTNGKIVFIDKEAKPTNERVTVGDFDTWKKSVVSILQTALKTDEKAAEKIFKHYEKDFKASHSAGKDAKTAVKDFASGMKKVKEQESGDRSLTSFAKIRMYLDKAKETSDKKIQADLINKAISGLSYKDFKSKGGEEKLKDHPLFNDLIKRYKEREDHLGEEYEGNTAPEKADYQDVKLKENLYKPLKIKENSSPLVKKTIGDLNKIIELCKSYINDTRK